jgi:DnaK suppressor protein
VNKTTARRDGATAKTARTAGKAAAAPARKAAPKATPKAVARPAARTPAHAKPAAKAAAKPAVKPVPKGRSTAAPKKVAAPKPAPKTKSAASPTTKAPVKKAQTPAVAVKSTRKPTDTTESTAATPHLAAPKAVLPTTPAPAPIAVPTPAPPPTRMSSSAKSKASAKAQAAYAAPAPMPVPTSRFADRFAPPRPPTRQMNHLEIDAPRQPQKHDPKLVNAWKNKAGRELSEAELLAMPEAEYMNEKQLDYFRATLQQLKDDLLSNAGETTEHLREDTSIVPDPADRATIEEEHALELRTRDRERKLLKKISQSLARIESGEYGFCDETGEPIGLGRLLARPTATLSLEAQQRRELKQKMFGD